MTVRAPHPSPAPTRGLSVERDGMTNEEIADAPGISIATVKTDWVFARRFLIHELEGRVTDGVDAVVDDLPRVVPWSVVVLIGEPFWLSGRPVRSVRR